MGESAVAERRSRRVQRHVVDDVLADDAVVLRTVEGEVVVYDELSAGNRRATQVRGKVLPDGELLFPERHRFRR